MDKLTHRSGSSALRGLALRTRKILAWVGALTGVTLVIVALLVHRPNLDRDLMGLPEADRRALFERTLTTLKTTCAYPRGPDLSDYCREQAAFIVHFRECDGTCRDLAAHFAQQPAR